MCGAAKCVEEDLNKLEKARGRVARMAVKSAILFVDAEHLYSHCCVEAQEWKAKARSTPMTHSTPFTRPPYKILDNNGALTRLHRGVDHWWFVELGGSSGWEAAKVAVSMGYDEVVMCGCPLIDMGYAYQGKLLPGDPDELPKAYRRFARTISRERKWHENIFSMSGQTAEILGSPYTCVKNGAT